MKLGLIGDIHSNLPALEAVLRELDGHEVDRIFNVGDLVSYGPFPNEVVNFLRDRKIVSIQGNRDKDVYEANQISIPINKPSMIQMKLLSYEWTHRNLSAENLGYLKALPDSLSVHVGRYKLLMVHSRLSSKIPQLQPDTPDLQYEKVAADIAEDIVAFGHTHIPFTKMIAQKVFVNTGSVGRPGDGDPRAAYVLLTAKNKQITSQVNRVEYDVGRTAEAVRKSELPDEFALMFIHGRKFDDVAILPP